MTQIRGLGYVQVQSTDVPRWRKLMAGCLALQEVTGPRADALYLRMGERATRLTVVPGPVDRVLAVGWEVRDQEALTAVGIAVEAAGRSVEVFDPAACEARRVEAGLRFEDPARTPVEVFFGPLLDHRPLLTGHAQRFITGALGMGHVVVPTPVPEATTAFYTDVLGFRPRGTIRLPEADPTLPLRRIRFLGVNERHHSLAICPAPAPGLVHVMVEVDTPDATLGRHPHDKPVDRLPPGGHPRPSSTERGDPWLMSDDVLDQIRDLLPGIAARAEATEESRRVSTETIDELRVTGFFRLLQPRRYGGLEQNPLTFYEGVRALSGACGSTGWVASVLGVHPWQLSLFPQAAQEEVWSAGPDVLLASSYAPVGQLTETDGGYRLSGRWSFSSGCDHAAWFLLGALVIGPSGSAVDFITTLVERDQVEIIDVWNTIGLRGTGSNDLVVRDLFLPAHRVLRNFEHSRLAGPGQEVNPGPLYRMPFGALFTSTVTAPLIGVVQGSIETYIATMTERHRLSFGGGRFTEDQFAQVALARAASEIDAAILQMDRNIAELYAAASAGREIPMELRLRTRRDQVRGTERALAAIDLLFKTAGGNSLRHNHPIGRAWRDAHAGSVHVANDVERTLALYGKWSFGIPVEDNLV